MRKLIFIFLAALPGAAATITVCASGCAYSNLQTALNAANRGDFVELKAGEVFEGVFSLPFKSGSGYVTVRSSRWRELPPPGTRITVAEAALMPKLQPPYSSGTVIDAGYYEQYVSSISTSTDTIAFENSHGFADGEPIACRHDNGAAGPVVRGQVYYVRDSTSNTIKFSDRPFGPVVDLVNAPPVASFRCTSAKAISHWRFTGIEIRKKPGQVTEYNLTRFGSDETTRAGTPHHIELDRVYIHGIDGENGPRICVVWNVAHSSITDSRIEHCNKEGEEGKAISSWLAPGPILLRNNYIAAGSINLLLGGDYMRIEGLVNGDNGGIVIEKNHFTRALSAKFNRGTGGTVDPTGSCGGDGSLYLNVTTGNWFRCNGSSWVAGAACALGEYYRRTDVTQTCAGGACWQCSGSNRFEPSASNRGSSYFTKNLFEIKNGMNLVVQGNVFENNWVNGDQSGVAIWITSQVSQYNGNGWVRGENIRFENNIVLNSSQGLRIAAEGSTAFGVPNNRLQVLNNLLYGIGNTQYPSLNSVDARPLSFAGRCDDCVVDHNTVVSGVTWGSGMFFDTAPMARFRMSNNIGYANHYGVLGEGGLPISHYAGAGAVQNTVFVDNTNSQGAPSSFGSWAVNGRFIPASVALFTGAGNYRLLPASPYSASCSTGCDFTGTDGKDLGADIDMVESVTSGATTGNSRVAALRLRVDSGSRHAIVRYTAPDSNSCSITVFLNPARTQTHADTGTTGNQLDSRPGNLSNGRRREFVLGAVSPLTPSTTYYARVDCGSLRVPLVIHTQAAGDTVYHELRLPVARQVRYDVNPAFSNPVTLPPALRHLIPVSTAAVVYAQVETQPPTVLTGR